MAKYSMCLLFLIGIFQHAILVSCRKPLVPALYVFGDSLSDSGNNNFLQTNTKVNSTPYGIDFPSETPTGRFTNGKTFIDFIAQDLGLPLVPASLGLSNAEKKYIRTGVNYASGAAGILPETGDANCKTAIHKQPNQIIGDILSLDEQIKYFHVTVKKDLKNIFKPRAALSNHLSKSIFFVIIGSNDYINNYLQPASYQSSQIYTPEQFAELLTDRLKKRLMKIVVFNIGRIGCVPAIRSSASLRPTTPCVEDVNNLVLLYNTRLPNMITYLERTLPGSIFVRGDSYNMNKSSSEAGFLVPQVPCCQVNSITGLCLEDSTPCSVRNTSIFWDAFHPTETVNSAQANDCFSGSSSCVPINIQKLAQMK